MTGDLDMTFDPSSLTMSVAAAGSKFAETMASGFCAACNGAVRGGAEALNVAAQNVGGAMASKGVSLA
jgi:hypothetical protein